MKKLSHILAVVDPAADVQPALRRAAWLAARTDAKLELLICYYNEYLTGDSMSAIRSLQLVRKEVIESYQEHLESLAKPLRDHGIDVSTTAIWDHPLHEGIVRHAIATGAIIIFKDSHHHSLLSRTLLSNSDWDLIRSCPLVLWLVKPVAFPRRPLIVAAIDPVHEYDKPSALDDQILDISNALAKAVDGDVRAFHSYDPRKALVTATANAYIPVSLSLDEIEKDMRGQHEKRFVELTDFHGITRDRTHLVSGRTHEELPALAKKLNASVVVMGAIQRNRHKRLFVGATAECTLEQLPCDVLVVKPALFRTPVDVLKAANA